MSDLADFRTEFGLYVRDSSVNGLFTAANKDLWINKAVRWMFDFQRVHRKSTNIQTELINLVSGTQEYPVFASFALIGIRRVRRLLPETDDYDLVDMTKQEQNQYSNSYYIIGKTIGFTRDIDATITGAVKVWGEVYPATLSDAASTLTGLQEDFKEVVALKAALLALATEASRDQARYIELKSEFGERTELLQKVGDDMLGGPQILDPYSTNDGIF